MRLLGAVLVVTTLAGCSDDSETTIGAGGGSTEPCAIGEVENETGQCCPPGTLPVADGCQAAGVATCGEGFEPDGVGGCEPILPAAPCADGEVALVGESACRRLLDCGSGTWGAIPSEATNEHVDAAYTGGASDGSAQNPWTTIQAAIDAAAPGAIVAVAEGSYAEDLTIGKRIRLMGRCPELVEVVGQGGVAALVIRTGATDAEIDGLAVTGTTMGIVVSGATNVKLTRLWVHDVGSRGVDFENSLGDAGGVLSGSLVERARDASVILLSADLVMEDTIIREAMPNAGGYARGLVVKRLQGSAVRSHASVARSIIERTQASGIIVEVSDLEVQSSVIRDVLPELASQQYGRGVELQGDAATGELGNATLRGSLVERTHDSAIFVTGATLLLDEMVLRDTSAQPVTGIGGEGVLVQPQGATRSSVTVQRSLLVRHRGSAIVPLGSDLLVESVIVRDMLPGNAPIDDDVPFGVGVFVQDDLETGARSMGTVRGSVIERALGQALRIAGSDAVIESVAVTDPQPSQGIAGNGLAAIDNPMTGNLSHLELRASSFDRCVDGAIVVSSSTAVLENIVVRDTLPHAMNQTHGVGIVSQAWPGTAPPPDTTLRRVRIERSLSFGVLAVFGSLRVDGVEIVDVGKQPSDGTYGDGIALMLATATIDSSRIERALRVGVSNFSGNAVLGGSALQCIPIPMSRQDVGGPTTFNDAGENRCGCGAETEACKVVSTNITPPAPLE